MQQDSLWKDGVMKILFTADLHGEIAAFKKFVHILDSQEFDVGVIAGDLTDMFADQAELIEIMVYEKKSRAYQRRFKVEQAIKTILHTSQKPILIIRGNHDSTEWASIGNVYNIHKKRVKLGGCTFLGYQDTEWEKSAKTITRDLEELKSFITPDTVLVTHIAPYGVLDENSVGERTGHPILRTLLERNRPMLHLFGHVHESAGVQGSSVNGAFCKHRAFFSIDLSANSSSGILIERMPWLVNQDEEVEK